MGSRNKTAARYLCQLLDYDENSKTYPITGTPNTGFTVTYRQNGSTVANPTNLGKYDVVITRAEDGTYVSYSKTITDGLVIDKIQASAFTVVTPKDTFTSFDVITQDLETLTPSDFTITFGGTPVVASAVSSYAGGKYTISIPSQTADSTKVLSVTMNDTLATHNGKSATVDNFSRFVERIIEITQEQAQKITTAVMIGADGSMRHVPTGVFQKDGKYYATINSLTNSIYVLIENKVSFNDAQGKWYEKTVNEMAGRKIINGIGAGNFSGERSITRAEFAAILVRALGLPANGTSTFGDVPAEAWYSGAVATEAQYGFVGGRGNNRFDPAANITRQEAMAMLARAAKLTDFTGKTSILSAFSDSGSVDEWALEAAKWNVGSGLIMGNNGQLRPTDNISRAETATVILRLLQTAELVDVRS